MSDVFGVYLDTVDLAGIADMEPHDVCVPEAECYLEAFASLARRVPNDDCFVIGDASNSTDLSVSVYIKDDGSEGNRDDGPVPTIAIEANGRDPFLLNWQQARALVVALARVEGIARVG